MRNRNKLIGKLFPLLDLKHVKSVLQVSTWNLIECSDLAYHIPE